MNVPPIAVTSVKSTEFDEKQVAKSAVANPDLYWKFTPADNCSDSMILDINVLNPLEHVANVDICDKGVHFRSNIDSQDLFLE